MANLTKYILKLYLILLLFFVLISNASINDNYYTNLLFPPDTSNVDTLSNDSVVDLPYPFNDDESSFPNQDNENNMYLNTPSNIKSDIEYDPETNQYIFTKKIGDFDYRAPDYMSIEDYINYDIDQSLKENWQKKSKAQGSEKRKGLIPQLHVGGAAFDKIFGGSTIDIRPAGSAELIFGINFNNREDPALNVKQQKTANFDFQEKIQMNVTAKIGDKIELGVNYNTEATFEFENKMKLQYQGKEDEIIKNIEAGDVTLPLPGSLITGNQSLFGLKTKLQFGKLFVTSVFSQQKSQTSTIEVSGGAQVSQFSIKADQYEENKHFFIAQYFKDNYKNALKKLPVINSQINITKIEVWVTNIGAATTENRNIVAFMDIGEDDPYNDNVISSHIAPYPLNNSNNLYTTMDNANIRDINTVNSYLNGLSFVSGLDYEKVESARKLSSNEYTFNSKMGFISLNSYLTSDQVLAVAYQYTIIGDTTTYQVGEFSNSGISAPKTLIVKLLKSTALNTKIPMWDLMMKNVYSIGAYQVNSQDFRLNVLYSDDRNGVLVGYISEGVISGIPLIRVMGLDRLNIQLDLTPDGVFDFIDGAQENGGTIQASNGRIFFPVLQPFGKDLREAISNPAIAEKYAYDSLYTLTKNEAQQYPDKNKFILEGTYKSSSSSEISLNAMNVPQGSVKVTAGGIPLTENVDYTVDYTLGRVKIINDGILNSGTPISISLESTSLFNIQTKTLLGTHLDYVVNKDLNIGATILNLTERPMTQKINFGNEPISNTIWGLNGTYQTESRFITKMIDKLPFINTKAPSKITFDGEFAQLIPGHSRAIGKGSQGTSYIDDFEGSKSSIDLKNVGAWFLSSAPQGQINFPEADIDSSLAYGFNRAKLCWYVIDPLFNRMSNLTPQHIKDDKTQRSNHFVREVIETEVFPNKENPNNIPIDIAVLNLSFYPDTKGPYNYDVQLSPYSKGIDANGNLLSPETRWGGIMRKIVTTDFEETNVEYIEFWMMDPFVYSDGQNGNPLHSGGYLYFNLGDISEDVLKDSRKSYENGLPVSETVENVDTTIWGRIPTLQPLTNSFDNEPRSREFQDVGFDGLRNQDEKLFFNTTYIQKIADTYGTNSQAYTSAYNDPSNDDYHYFRGGDYDSEQKSILDRYKIYNNMDGNSPTSEQSPESYPTSSTTLPNIEDINRDNTLSEAERYYQYKIALKPDKMQVGENYITDVYEATTHELPDGTKKNVKWYQFKIPIHSPDKVVGNIQGFKSIRFMRVFFKDFIEPIHCRFATLELVRGEWRKYNFSLLTPGEYIPSDDCETTFDVSTVNIEENGKKIPVNYVLPPDIEREIYNNTTSLQKMNEQSLSLKVINLCDGFARAVYKTCDLDVRQYKKFKMYVHAEALKGDQTIRNNELTVFLRFGTDFTNNYYEYEIPLTLTPEGVYDNNDEENRKIVWPENNSFLVDFEALLDVKQERNIKMRESGSTITLTMPYIKNIGNNKITVVGTPNISSIKTIMIGIRNPKKKTLTDGDDMLPKGAEVWVNELRLTDFNEKGGWAAIARVSANLADLGNIAIAGNKSTPGFGSIEKKINERQKENITQYDIATNLALDKFLPEKAGLKIPMHFDYSEIFSNPQYNPLNPDIDFKEDLKTYSTKAERDSIKHLSQDYTRRKSINFMNVRKIKTGKSSKSHIYDVENFDLTYAYSEIFKRNVDIEYDIKKTYKGALGYSFANNPKKVMPFSKIKFLTKHRSLRLIKDFNFYYMPKMLSFRTDLDRQYNEQLLRNKSSAIINIDPTYVKTFTWNRLYNLKYDLASSLKINFSANANARIDEPAGKIDKDDADYKEKRDSILHNIYDFGRITVYNQKLDVDYSIPISKIPLLNWINSSARYSGEYHWTAAPLSIKELGNTIENSNTKQLNGNANLITLYNKINYLKELNKKQRPKNIAPKNMLEMEAAQEDTTEAPKINYLKLIVDNTLKILMGVRNVSASYSESNGTLLPGFMSSPVALGMDWNSMAPGMDFVFGSQRDIRDDAAKNGWLTTDSVFNSAYMTKYTQNLSLRSTIEPITDFRIELTANRNFAQNHQNYFRVYENGDWEKFSSVETGSFSISYMTINTAFIKNEKDHSNKIFENFKKYRITIAERLANNNSNNWKHTFMLDTVSGINYPSGYGPTSQDVLIPAFLAAYSGQNPDDIGLSPFPKIPKPNWRITYNGLSKIKFLKKYFKSVNLGHAYRSSYNVGSYTTNVLYKEDEDGFQKIRDELGERNFIPEREINQISITEQFSPLININMTWNNSMLTNFEIKKTRNLSMSFANNQLTEVSSKEIIVGFGYRIKNVVLYVKSIGGGGRKKRLESDINIKADVSVRNNETVLRKLIENSDQISSGQQVISINLSTDYMISEQFTIRAFFDKIINNPFVSSQYKNSNTNAGISIRFTLAQ